ncbi:MULTISPECIES: hypothetical protein [unclassified Microcoleus]|uniref:hypothetical protein n=1 Tax=unclassified Microcoleus TaxID=2642155 RepID=UPI002FD2C286
MQAISDGRAVLALLKIVTDACRFGLQFERDLSEIDWLGVERSIALRFKLIS